VTSSGYKEWVKNLKEGDLVLLMDNNAVYSSPVIFLNWNGDSSSNGYRAQHLYIPDWNIHHYWYGNGTSEEERQQNVDDQWESTFKELEKHGSKSRRFDVSIVNAHAEKKYFPFPKEFLTKRQKKFVKLINKIKGYEY
tara:strand:+ start:1022 stop:1435 length:414 start_codon:yes stop_codon:yes gene_type:complete